MLNITNQSIENAIGNNTIIRRQTIQGFVVDFRQWFRHGYEVPMYAYIMPIWSLLIVCVYLFMVFVFIRNGLIGKTYSCLIAIAVCDCLGAICPSVMWFFVFGIRNHFYFLPLEWCRAFHYTVEVLPNIITSTSQYLTILLAVTRYIIVAFPFRAKTLCSENRLRLGIMVCFLLPLALRIVQFFHYDYFGITVPAYNKPNETMQACVIQAQSWLEIDFYRFLAILQAVYLFTFCLVPTVTLTITEILLISSLVAVKKRRRYLQAGKSPSEHRELRLTIATSVIVLLTLLYGISVVVVQTIDFLFLFFDLEVIKNTDLRSVVSISNTAFWLMIPSNFIIVSCLSQDFRSGVSALFRTSSNMSSSMTYNLKDERY